MQDSRILEADFGDSLNQMNNFQDNFARTIYKI